jgi:hypothetical protein
MGSPYLSPLPLRVLSLSESSPSPSPLPLRVLSLSESSPSPSPLPLRVLSLSESSPYPSPLPIRVFSLSESSPSPSPLPIRVFSLSESSPYPSPSAELQQASVPCHGTAGLACAMAQASVHGSLGTRQSTETCPQIPIAPIVQASESLRLGAGGLAARRRRRPPGPGSESARVQLEVGSDTPSQRQSARHRR